jgi:hypothetical protein
MERSVELPERCVVCNEPASERVSRKLRWSPTWWRIVGGVAPFVLLAAGAFGGQIWLLMLFWPLVIVLVIAHLIVRQAFRVALGACARHKRLRQLVIASSLGAMALIVLGLFYITTFEWASLALVGGAIVTAALAVVPEMPR